ncbi:OAF-like protein, partial [Mya arenaria]
MTTVKHKLNILSFIILTLLCNSYCQLIVNVKNRGGDVERETIEANTTADTIRLEFLSMDGTHVTHFIDFKADVQVFRVFVPWEEERGLSLPQPQVLCFVTRFGKNEFISSDAMSKLRQKNPTAIRSPEEDRGVEKHTLDLLVSLDRSALISPYLYNICMLNKDLSKMMSAVKSTESEKISRCKDTTDIKKPCTCQYHLCIGWYPCGLKYCRGKDSAGKVVNYRCGIKTCRRCLLFEHYA